MRTDTDQRETGLIRSLNVRDVSLMIVVAVVSLRWIPRGARAGPSSVLLWLLAGMFFFVPLALSVMDLGARFPEQGGLYVWSHRAFGPAHGFFCAWCLWLNQIFYFPSYLLFAFVNFLGAGGRGIAHWGESRAVTVLFVLLALWVLTLLNVFGFALTKWIQNLGTIGIWIPICLLFAFAFIALNKTGSATSFAPQNLVPSGSAFGTLALWSSMCFGFSGVEIASFVSQEIQNPRRSFAIAVTVACVLITVVYIGGSVAILLVIPVSVLNERTGVADAIASAIGVPFMGGFVSLLIGAAAVATTSSWIAAAARIPFAAGLQQVFPAVLSRLHSRFRTPHIALAVQAIAASLVLLVSLFFSLDRIQVNVEEAYDVLVNLTILLYFVPYLYLFLAAMRFSDATAVRRLIAIAGLITTGLAILLLFVPPPGTRSILNFEASILVQGVTILALGPIIYRVRTRLR